MGDNYYGSTREGWVPLVKEAPKPAPVVTEEVIPAVDPKAALIEEFEREFQKLQTIEEEIVDKKGKKKARP